MSRLIAATSLCFAEFVYVWVVNAPSAYAYLWFLFLACTSYRLLFGQMTAEPILLYAYYGAATILLFWAQSATLPEFVGFSGPLGIGTDDSYYYSLAADDVPADFPVREGYWLSARPYARFLQFVTPIPIRHPFDVLFANVAILFLLPVFTGRLAMQLSSDSRVAKISYVLALVCPFVLANGIILIRDGVTASLFVGTIVLVLDKRYVAGGALFGLLFFLRLASGLQLLFALAVFLPLILDGYKTISRKLAFLMLAAAVGMGTALLSLPALTNVFLQEGLLDSGLFRAQFLVEHIARLSDTNLLVQSGDYPWFLRIPVSMAFILAGPFLGLDILSVDGVWIPRSFLNTLFALLSIWYLKFFVQGIVVLIQRPDRKMMVGAVTFLLLILILSQLSLVIRHKTMLMPLFYVVVAYGVVRSTSLGRTLGTAAAASLAGVQVLAMMSF